jgi:hypothetical protein
VGKLTFEDTIGLDEYDFVFVTTMEDDDRIQVIIRKNKQDVGFCFISRTILKGLVKAPR